MNETTEIGRSLGKLVVQKSRKAEPSSDQMIEIFNDRDR